MKDEVLVSAEQKLAEDQLCRGISIRVSFKYLSAYSWGYAIGDRPIVQYTPMLSGNALVIELLDPNPEYEECGEPLQTIWIIDLAGEFDLIDAIEAISDHLIDHQTRHENPCENHPAERCGDCHLRSEPCFECGATEDKINRCAPFVQSDLYAELMEIVEVSGLQCVSADHTISRWSWNGRTAINIQQHLGHVDLVFEDWVIDRLLDESGLAIACPVLRFKERGDFGLLCHQLVSAFMHFDKVIE